MPNSTAYIVLFGWPLVVFILFRILPRAHALIWSIVGGYLFLPFGVGINPPLVPTLDKNFIPVLAAAIMCVLGGSGPPEPESERAPPRRPAPVARSAHPVSERVSEPAFEPAQAVASAGASGSRFTRQKVRRPTRTTAEQGAGAALTSPGFLRMPRSVMALLLLLILTQILTVQTNLGTYPVGPRRLPGLTWYDASSLILMALVMIMPFLLGLRYLGMPSQQAVLLRIFCVAGMIYSLPTLFEIRMSPQISRWVYGFLAQSFAQAKRYDGFRPVVFLQHGLWLALFLAMAALACFALWRSRKGAASRGIWLMCGGFLAVVLLLCHSLGAVVVLILLAPVVLFMPVRLQVLAAAMIALVVVTYPMLRGAGLVPVNAIYNMAAGISVDRADSLKFRFDNEDQLLAHANEQPMAGWGGYGRDRLHDPKTGLNISTTDGAWVILMGQSGWFGYIATFGLLTAPIFLLLWNYRTILPDAASAGLCLVLAANLIDMIPNATMTPLTWLIAGALAGRSRVPGQAPPQEDIPDRPRNRGGSRRGAGPVGITAALALAVFLGGLPQARAMAQDVPEVPQGVGLTDPTLAFGLNGISDSSTELPFLDLMKTSRLFVGHDKSSWSAMTNDDLQAGGWLDEAGWPKQIPPGISAVGTIWAWNKQTGKTQDGKKQDGKKQGGTKQAGTTLSGTKPADPQQTSYAPGVYVLTYKGTGTLSLEGDVEVLKEMPGQIILRNRSGGTMSLDITQTDPGRTGDYIRDISMVPQKYLALWQAGEVFNPDWLPLVQDARLLRFMDWMKTNGKTAAHWEDRPLPSDSSYGRRGVPVEVMVQLANQTGTEPWFTMPAGADEAYIRNFATYVRDHVNPDLKVHVEYSNETWNWAFDQTKWLAKQAETVWGSKNKSAYIDYNAMLATRSALLWREVFGDQAKARLDMVLGIQTGSSNNANRLLTAPLWQENDPSGYVAPASVFTSLAVTTYFGAQALMKPDLRTALLEAIRTDPVAASAELTRQMQDATYPSSIPQIEKRWQQSKEVAQKYGLDLVAYEGGQHILQSFHLKGISDEDMALLTDFLGAYVRSPAMAELYHQLWTAWAATGQGPFMQFGDVDAISKFGAWGLYQSIGDRNPRADLLVDLNAHEKSWFGDGGGSRYQQGVIRLAAEAGETLVGTGKDDFLIGGPGADVIVPGTGQDAVAGGEGQDVLVLAGAPGDYTLTPEPDGTHWQLTGPALSVRLSGIESFRFAGGITKTLADMPPG